MTYDEDLAAHLRETLEGIEGIAEKAMMGGVCFLLNGHMIGGISSAKMLGESCYMFRVGKDNEVEALSRPGAQTVEMGGRKMGGMIFVRRENCDGAALKDWVALALNFVTKLPPK